MNRTQPKHSKINPPFYWQGGELPKSQINAVLNKNRDSLRLYPFAFEVAPLAKVGHMENDSGDLVTELFIILPLLWVMFILAVYFQRLDETQAQSFEN